MIKIERVYTCNWEAAKRSMRNPMNSWDKSDSGYGCGEGKVCRFCPHNFSPDWCGNKNDHYILGPNDRKLALQLAKAGSDHGKFLRSIIFSCDITAPMYWWKEMDTYKVGTVRNSCSTMHKITAKEFELDDFSHDKMVSNGVILEGEERKGAVWDSCGTLLRVIDTLNYFRDHYVSHPVKSHWYSLIQLLPSSYNQKATWTANYEVLRNIYHARKNHKLEEWREFCAMIEKLPYSELITEVRE